MKINKILVAVDGSPLAEEILPFIAHRVIRTAPCPVLTVGPGSQKEETRRGP